MASVQRNVNKRGRDIPDKKTKRRSLDAVLASQRLVLVRIHGGHVNDALQRGSRLLPGGLQRLAVAAPVKYTNRTF